MISLCSLWRPNSVCISLVFHMWCPLNTHTQTHNIYYSQLMKLFVFLRNELQWCLFRDCIYSGRPYQSWNTLSSMVCLYLEITHVVPIWVFIFMISQFLWPNSEGNFLFPLISQHQIKSRLIFAHGISSYSSACSVSLIWNIRIRLFTLSRLYTVSLWTVDMFSKCKLMHHLTGIFKMNTLEFPFVPRSLFSI